MKETYPFKLKPLLYEYNAMEPYIDSQTIMLHHDKHLGGYVNSLNEAIKKYPEYYEYTLEELLKNLDVIPKDIVKTVKNSGGGVYNHNIYFEGLKNIGENNAPIGRLAGKIKEQYIDFNNFYDLFKKASLELFGSGFVWLALNSEDNLEIISTPNQDTILNLSVCPIILIDVWEHAYYLQYNNRRSDYIDKYKNIIDWNKAEEKYLRCLKGNNNIIFDK